MRSLYHITSNSQLHLHADIQFTAEHEYSGQIAFLDNDTIDVYRKRTELQRTQTVIHVSTPITTSDLKIGTREVHVTADGESEMYYSLGTSVRKVTRLNVANVVRFSLYI